MPSCSVKWCSNHTSTCSLKSKNGVSFHRFPKDEETCHKWVEAVRHERRDPWWTSSNASRICSIHFKETDISSTPCKVNVLAKTAVPICTMVWYDGNENNTPSVTFNEKAKIDKPILKTYARKKTNMNVLKESKVNTSYNCKKESTTISKINSVAISNMTPCQDSVPQATKLLKTIEVSKTQHWKEGLEAISVTNIDLNTSAKENLTEVQKNTVLTELNKTENIKSKEKCSKSNILVKLNDNTNLILDESLGNDDTKFKESNNFSEETNTRTCENSKKSNENKEPNQVTNISNSDTFVQTLINGNVDLNENISKSYVGKMLKTYLPKRKDKISEKLNKKTPKLKKNKSVWTITMDKGLNMIKCNEINYTSVKHIKHYYNNKLKTGVCHKNNIITDLQSNPQEKKELCALNNVKKYTIKRINNLFNGQRIGEQNKSTVDVEPNKDVNKESNISYLDDFISNQSRIDKTKETDTAVYDEIISELFETSKNVSNTLNNSNYQASNENVCKVSNTVLCTANNIDSALDNGTNNRHVILDLDTNNYTELNTVMDAELYSVVNTGLIGETNTEIYTDNAAINEIIQYNENTATEPNQHLTIMNNNMATEHSDYLISDPCYYLHTETNGNITQDNQNMSCNENLTNNAIILSNNELQNLETSVVKNIVPETKKVEFNILKKYLTLNSKLDSPSEFCTNVLTDIDKNIFSRYDNIPSTSLTKENLQVSDRDDNAEFNKNIDIEVNDMIAPLQNNINTSATTETESIVTSSKQINSIFLEDFITNIAPKSSNSENVDFIINSYTDPNTTKLSEFNGNNISDINVECTKILEKDMKDLETVINLEFININENRIALNDEISVGLNEELNTDKTNINADPTPYNESTVTESDQSLSITNENLPMEHSDNLIPESEYYLDTEMNENITTEGNKNIRYNENISSNTIIVSNNQLQILDTSVVNNIEAKKDKFTELRKHLSTKPKLNSLVDLCTNTLTDTDKNWFSKYSTMSTAITKENIQVPDRGLNAEFDKNLDIEVNDEVTSLENNMYTDVNKETEPILLEELITNITPVLTNTQDMNFINNLKTVQNKTRPTFNQKMSSDDNECNKILGKDMPELNTVILSELNEDQILKSKEVMPTKFYNLNAEKYDKDVLLQKSKKKFVNVLPMPDDQHTVVNKHMDVVDSILNRDVAADFDLSLLLSDTPIPDEDIQNVDNSNNNSLDGIGGSPNWIQLPSGEMPKIIDDILDQGSPYFGNLDLFDKVNKFNMHKEAYKKDNGKVKKYLNSNFEQFEEQVINNYCETGKPCTKNSIAQIEKQLLAEISDYNETNLEQSYIICNENKVSRTKKDTAEKNYDLCNNQTGKQILEQYLHLNNEQCDLFNLDQIVDKCYEHCKKEIQGKTINLCPKPNNIDSLENQIENPGIDQYFEQSENLHREQGGLNIENSNEVLNDVNIFKLRKIQSNKQTYQPSVGKLVTMEDSIPKSNFVSQGTLESSVQEINNHLFEDFNESRKEVNNVSNEAHTVGTEIVRALNIGKLKRVIFEECYDPECGNDCKNQKHNSSMKSHKKDNQQYKKQTNNTSSQPDIDKQKSRFNVLYKRQRYQSSTDSLNKQLNDGSVDPKTKQKKKTKFLERPKLSHNEKCKTNYKKIAIDDIPGQYVELRWNESNGKSNTISQDGCKRKHKELALDQRKMLCSESTNNFSQQIMECPECGYTTDDNDLINYKSDVDLRITKPLSLINKDMLISLRDTQNNGNNKKVTLESVYAMELAYVTAIQALERKLKQKMAISEYRLRKVNNLSKINNQLTKASVTLMDFTQKNKV